MENKQQSLAGIARAASLTPEQRREIASKAGKARWDKINYVPSNEVLKAIAGSPDKLLEIGGVQLECYVLENGMRVLSGRGMQAALGMGQAHGTIFKEFIEKDTVKQLMDADLAMVLDKPARFVRPGRGGIPAMAYEATALPRLCSIILRARRERLLKTEAEHVIAEKAEILLGGLSEVGITALIDEVTGFQKKKDEYQQILADYIEMELRPWLMTFEENYYKQLYRLLGWDWDAFRGSGKNHPSYIGKLTNRIVYEKLPPGVLEALKLIDPKNDNGNRAHRFHQYLTENVGYRHLIKHITAVTTIMEMYPDGAWQEALQRIDGRFPTLRLPYQTSIPMP